MSTFIVIPSCREEGLKDFLSRVDFGDSKIIVVEDNDRKTFNLHKDILHYSHKEIADDIGEKSWIIPRRNASVRSYGYYKAWQMRAKHIVTIDDDCIPKERFIAEHIEALESPSESNAWTNTICGAKTRGIPFYNVNRSVPTIINHGLWSGNYDFDAVTQLTSKDYVTLPSQIIPRGNFYPMCGMNLAFKAEAAPMMYFLLQGPDYPYDRYDDIWAGVFTKKICDHLNYGVKSGAPVVNHTRASNVWSNLIKESTGYEINETLWQIVDNIVLTEKTILGCYIELATAISHINDYFSKLSKAMKVWGGLYETV